MTSFFFFNDTATTEIYTLSLHDALPISCGEVAYLSTSKSLLPPCRAARRAEATRITREEAQKTWKFSSPPTEASLDCAIARGIVLSLPSIGAFGESLPVSGTQVRVRVAVRAQGESVKTFWTSRSEEHTSELQSRLHLVCRLLLEKKKKQT